MGSKLEPGNFDCYHNALPDEPMFILLARDPSAPELVEDWATERQRQIEKGWRPKSDQAMVDEAVRCAGNMRHWRVVNNGAWRGTTPPAPVRAAREVLSAKAMAALRNYQQADEDGIMVLVSRQALDEAIAALATPPAPVRAAAEPVEIAWQLIDTAPKDRFIIVYCPEDSSRWLAKWQGGEWYGSDCEHGILRTGHSLNDPNYVTGWFVSHWRDVPLFAAPPSDSPGSAHLAARLGREACA